MSDVKQGRMVGMEDLGLNENSRGVLEIITDIAML
jgi:hypothetical protein